MRIERLEKRASEKQLVARPPWNNDAKDQRRVEVLRNRIEELDRRLAMLKPISRNGLPGFVERKPEPLSKFTCIAAPTLSAITPNGGAGLRMKNSAPTGTGLWFLLLSWEGSHRSRR